MLSESWTSGSSIGMPVGWWGRDAARPRARVDYRDALGEVRRLRGPLLTSGARADDDEVVPRGHPGTPSPRLSTPARDGACARRRRVPEHRAADARGERADVD